MTLHGPTLQAERMVQFRRIQAVRKPVDYKRGQRTTSGRARSSRAPT